MTRLRCGWMLCLGLWAGTTQALEVTVFTAEGLPAMQGLERAQEVFVLGETRAPLADLRFAWPGSLYAARDRAQQRLNDAAGRAALAQVQAHANAAALAQLLGIRRLPAVLVAPGYVVYGVYYVAQALEKVEAYRAAH